MRNRNHDWSAEGGESPPWRQRSWLLAAAFLATVLVMSGVAFLTGHDADGQDSTAPELGSPPKVGPNGRPGTCRSDDRAGGTPEAAPTDLRWRSIAGVKVPTSPTAGPIVVRGPVLWCFAHTPMGAVMAAHVIPAQMSGPQWRIAAERQVMPGFGRDIFVSQRSSVSDADSSGRKAGTFEGFSISDYNANSARIRLLIKNSRGDRSTTSISLRWNEGDWKVEPLTEGSLYSKVTMADGPDGFILWEK
ncbi:hypothetical protein ACIBQ5_33710 [Streptomyces massasporeus]|uniref:hypothetical protein n=1 Tax=Streptomyces massasporeus TaxID=67324 RepID=UPI0037AC6862